MNERKKKTFNLVLFAIMTALCYLGTFIMIPLPTGAKIHLGNLFCIIAALLLGGVKGGLVGSLGMGLNDLHFYLDTPSTIIRTLILKFLMGLVAGALFRVLRNKKVTSKQISCYLYVLAFIFLVMFGITLALYLKGSIYIESILINIHILVPICCLLFGMLFIFSAFFMRKRLAIYSQLLVAVSLATLLNICGEFITRLGLSIIIDGYGFMPALVLSLSKIPASIFTGILTTIVAVSLYPALEKALSYKFNDILSEH